MKRADLVVTVSEREKGLMEAAGVKNIHVWSHAVTRQTPSTPFTDRKDLLFVGGLHGPGVSQHRRGSLLSGKSIPGPGKTAGLPAVYRWQYPLPDLIRDRASETIVVTGYQEKTWNIITIKAVSSSFPTSMPGESL